MADSASASVVPVHTIVEVYRVADLGLECVLPSAEDEVNAACFHPLEVRKQLCRGSGQDSNWNLHQSGQSDGQLQRLGWDFHVCLVALSEATRFAML